jgi:hypothetical protein
MVELRTRYLGLDLPSPLVASASPLTGSLDGLRRLEAAVVLPSLFEEQLTPSMPEPGPAKEVHEHGQRSAGQGALRQHHHLQARRNPGVGAGVVRRRQRHATGVQRGGLLEGEADPPRPPCPPGAL